jgi:hypothetical protein
MDLPEGVIFMGEQICYLSNRAAEPENEQLWEGPASSSAEIWSQKKTPTTKATPPLACLLLVDVLI